MKASASKRKLLIASGILVALIIILSMGYIENMYAFVQPQGTAIPALPELTKFKFVLQKIWLLIKPI